MACRPQDVNAGEAFVGDLIQEMRIEIRKRLLIFWSQGIRGADFFIAAIGPALSVFGRHSQILRPDGSEVTVREFLDLVRRESTNAALEQVLGGKAWEQADPITGHYVTWVWSYGPAPLDAGEAHALGLATGTEYREVVREGSIAAEGKQGSKKVVKLRTIRERNMDDDDLGEDRPARPANLIDQLQKAAYLWRTDQRAELSAFRQRLGESRWASLRQLGQAVAECMPQGNDDRQMINGLLGSNVMAHTAPTNGSERRSRQPASERLPGMDDEPEK